ncbi:S41 family peptidase [Sphingomonas solaris]|nr:S41 family peptidase [Sphingomonas solaris]
MRWPGWTGAIAAALLAFATPAFAAPPSAVQAANVRVFDKAWSLVARRYWDRDLHGLDWAAERDRFLPAARDATDTRALYAAINALLARLGDSHVYAVSPERRDFARAVGKGEAESGFGFDAYESGGRWRVRAVRPEGPAARAGMRIGWVLVSVDGRPVDVDAHFGTADTATLVLEDEFGRRHTLMLEGEPLPPVPSRRALRLGGGVLLLAFDQFAPGDDRWLRREIEDIPDLRGVILDLRENEGGEAEVLDRVAGLFANGRQVVLRLNARSERAEKTSGRAVWLGPLAVLIGPRSASAAEALAAFLDESERAQTVGERTAGALTAGAEHRLPDGGRLTVAEHDVRTPGGARLEAVGLAPRYPVTPTLAQLRAGADPALAKAVALVSDR